MKGVNSPANHHCEQTESQWDFLKNHWNGNLRIILLKAWKNRYICTNSLQSLLLLLLLSRFSRVQLCDPIDGSLPGSPVPGILQARTLQWVAISFSNAWKWKVKSESEVAQSCPTLHAPMDCSLPGSSVHGMFQARVLERGAIAFSASVTGQGLFTGCIYSTHAGQSSNYQSSIFFWGLSMESGGCSVLT